MAQHEFATKVVDEIIRDLQDRGGIGDEWDDIDNDIKDMIREDWVEIVERNFNERTE